MRQRWSTEKADRWASEQAWFVGANFTPSTAINQLEMWQDETFDPATIDRELGYAEAIGMNLMRVYLHDLLWEYDRDRFVKRIQEYLAIAESHGIRTMFVIFDDCWHGPPKLGRQPNPKPRTHNSGWLQSPGHATVEDETQWTRLQRYVTELLETFKDDSRIAIWDLYNEPGNGTEGDDSEDGRRGSRSVPLLQATFEWARSVQGVPQPLTAALWNQNESTNACIAEQCDIASFHSYTPPSHEEFTRKWRWCRQLGRPVICSEYMARTRGSTFAACLPFLREHCIGAINWGLVSGKTQTIYPWGWNDEKGEPAVYFHDIFNRDGSFLYPDEEETIRSLVQ